MSKATIECLKLRVGLHVACSIIHLEAIFCHQVLGTRLWEAVHASCHQRFTLTSMSA